MCRVGSVFAATVPMLSVAHAVVV